MEKLLVPKFSIKMTICLNDEYVGSTSKNNNAKKTIKVLLTKICCSWKLIFNFKTIPLNKILPEISSQQFYEDSNSDRPKNLKWPVSTRKIHIFENFIEIGPKWKNGKSLLKFRCTLVNTEAVLSVQAIEKVRIPHSIVRIKNLENLTLE